MNILRAKNAPFRALHARLRPALLAALLILAMPAAAVQMDDLYTATVPLEGGSTRALNEAFDRALGEVLVKITGMPDVAAGAGRAGVLPEARSLVQQYSRLPDNKLEARFEPRALREIVDSAGLPVWGANRPLVAVWFAVDAGGGRRELMPDAGSVDDPDDFESLRAAVVETAGNRGLPVVLPILDAAERRDVAFADVWGEFQGPVMQASQRYGAEAILMGRARSFDPEDSSIRWSLTIGNEQSNWQGDAASGPGQAASILAQRLATYADSADTLRVLITEVGTLEKYGQVNRYLAGLNIIDKVQVIRVDGDALEFELTVRGDLQRLEQTLDRSRVLKPSSSEADVLEAGRLPDLVYAWADDS